jgi:hypothetical protein
VIDEVPDIKPLTFVFKGDRDYIHGPDLINASLDAFQSRDLTLAKFSLNRIIRAPSCVLKIQRGKTNATTAPFRGSIVADGERYSLEIDETNKLSADVTRIVYDEDIVARACTVEGERISLNSVSPFSFVETIVAMKKQFMGSIERADKGKRWIVTSIELNVTRNDTDGLSLVLRHNFQNKLVKSDIYARDLKCGALYFSLVTL